MARTQRALGLRFSDLGLLRCAFVHPCYLETSEAPPDLVSTQRVRSKHGVSAWYICGKYYCKASGRGAGEGVATVASLISSVRCRRARTAAAASVSKHASPPPPQVTGHTVRAGTRASTPAGTRTAADAPGHRAPSGRSGARGSNTANTATPLRPLVRDMARRQLSAEANAARLKPRARGKPRARSRT